MPPWSHWHRRLFGAVLLTLSCSRIDSRVVEETGDGSMQPVSGGAANGVSGASNMSASAGISSAGFAAMAGRGGESNPGAGGTGGHGIVPGAGGVPASSACPPMVQFGPVEQLHDLSVDGASESELWLSRDELTAYFISDRPQTDSPTASNIWFAERNALDQPFGPANLVLVAGAPPLHPYSFALSDNELELFIETPKDSDVPCGICRESAQVHHYLRGRRQDPFDLDDADIAPLSGNFPWLSDDGDRLYFSTSTQLLVASRAEQFGKPRNLIVFGDDYWDSLTLSHDELVLFGANYSPTLGYSVDLARRAGTQAPFGSAMQTGHPPIPVEDLPNWVSPDCSRLYFTRPNGPYTKLFVETATH